MIVERKVDMSISNLSTIGADIDHRFLNVIKLEGEDPLVFISGVSQYHDANGDHHPHETPYVGLFMTAHLYRSNCYGGAEWVITAVDKKELEVLLKKTAARVHQLLKSYRDQAITELLSDMRFTKALEKLESGALQIHAFANLMCIIPTEWPEKPLRATWIKEKLAEISCANPDQSISTLQDFLKKLRDRKALEANDLLGAIPCDITNNSLYKWAEECVTALSALELTVNAWTDAPTQKSESESIALLREEIKELRKEMLYLSEAKVSLIVTELEHKGLVEKIKKGRGNVLILKN